MISAPHRRSPTGAALAQPRAVRRIPGPVRPGAAWLFITPTSCFCWRCNIFPLIWTIYLSCHQLPRQSRPNVAMKWLGIELVASRSWGDPDIWAAMQVTAHFVIWTVCDRDRGRLRPGFLIDKKFRGHGVWTTIIPAADDAVAGRGRQFRDFSLPAADRAVQLRGRLFHRPRQPRRSRCWGT